MNRQDAAALSLKFPATWHGGPKAEMWAEELEPLHTNQARTTYERLRKSEEHAPSIAKFLAVYNSLTEVEQDWRKPKCPDCDNGGWVEQLPVEHHRQCAGDDRCHCSSVKPCHCPEGRARMATYTRLVAERKPA